MPHIFVANGKWKRYNIIESMNSGDVNVIGIYDCFGYGLGYEVSFEERYRLIKNAGFDCGLLLKIYPIFKIWL